MGTNSARDLREDAGGEFSTHLRGGTRKAARRHAAEMQQEGIPDLRSRGCRHVRGIMTYFRHMDRLLTQHIGSVQIHLCF